VPGQISAAALIFCLSILLAGCELVGGIFKAGMWVGVLIIAVVIGLIALIFRGRGKST
jgi:hypothetical protein